MENLIDKYWPVCPGCITTELLRPHMPVGPKALLEAYRSSLMTQDELCMSILEGQVPPPDDAMLRIFVRTRELVERDLDFRDELHRLTTPKDASLWYYIAPVILDSRISTQQMMRNIDALYHSIGRPFELEPFTLFAEGGGDGRDHSAEKMDELRALLAALRKH